MLKDELTSSEIEKDEFYRTVLSHSVGKYVLEYVEELDFREIAEDAALQILEKVQKIILEDMSEIQKIACIEDVFLKYGLPVSGDYD